MKNPLAHCRIKFPMLPYEKLGQPIKKKSTHLTLYGKRCGFYGLQSTASSDLCQFLARYFKEVDKRLRVRENKRRIMA